MAPASYTTQLNNIDCPHQIGASVCECILGHPGMHVAIRRLTKDVEIEVFWADEWPMLSAEADLQISGSAAEVGLA